MTGLLELPGAWMLKIQCCHCWGVGSISGLGSSLCHGCGGPKKKKKKKKIQGGLKNVEEHKKGKRKSKATWARILKTPFPFPYNYAVSVTRGGVSAVCHRRAHVGYPAAKTRPRPYYLGRCIDDKHQNEDKNLGKPLWSKLFDSRGGHAKGGKRILSRMSEEVTHHVLNLGWTQLSSYLTGLQ